MYIKYDFKNNLKGSADGTIKIITDSEANENPVKLYWGYMDGDALKPLDDYTPLWSKAMPENGLVIDKGLLIPYGAKVLAAETDTESAVLELPEEKLPETREKPEATIAFASDFHFGGWGSENGPKPGIAMARQDMNKYADALVIAGDVVQWHGSYSEEEFMKYNFDGKKYGDNGERSPEYVRTGIPQWEVLTEYLKGFEIPVLVTHGGHDIRDNKIWSTMCSNDDYWRDFLKSWLSYSAKQGRYEVKRDESVCYYDAELFGYRFILLEVPEGSEPVISKEQLEWLDKKLFEYEKSGKPIFVIGHEPCLALLNIGGRETMKNLDEFRQILNKHPSSVYVSGHSHYTLDTLLINSVDGAGEKASCFHDGGMTTICSEEYKGQATGSHSIFAEIYDDCAILKGRDHIAGKWISLGLTSLTFKKNII